METKKVHTADGSHTLYVPHLDEHYHSIHGAIQEALHVFIAMGLHHSTQSSLSILEIGFGTGLNALLTQLEAEKLNKNIYYHSLEGYPLSVDEVKDLNYIQEVKGESVQTKFDALHDAKWEKSIELTTGFTLHKQQVMLQEYEPKEESIDLIYFDAFGPRVQPELWEKSIFDKMFTVLKPNGVLVTYCAKGDVRRTMLASGFEVERLPGPPGKREMLRATKPSPSA